jgi:glycosyltransferase involved in cell wall biosynthesis
MPGSRFDVVIISPDCHIRYDGRTPNGTGVGGGLTARVRLAAALARQSQRVTVVCNCPAEKRIEGVWYRSFADFRGCDTDILILNTTGGQLDLTPVLNTTIKARLRIVWVQGVDAPKGLSPQVFDHLCAPSNFIRAIAETQWGIAGNKLFVCHNGIERCLYRRGILSRPVKREPYRLIFNGHPSKGLDYAIQVLRALHKRDRRFELHVFGGNRLWGQSDPVAAHEPGLVWHGMLGQKQLIKELLRGSFALHLQTRLEPFGIALAECMAAGAIVLASPVGAYPELVQHGYNGLMIPGDPRSPAVQQRAVDYIQALSANPDWADYIRRNAKWMPLDWDTLARAWLEFWRWVLSGSPETGPPFASGAVCPECNQPSLALADGYHCIRCGLYSRAWKA